MKIIDLSIPIEDGLPSDPPIQIPKIQYCNHKDTAEQMAGFFKGCTVEDLPEGNGWGIEFLQVCTHSGTHVDAPYHYYPTMNGGERAWTIDEVPLDWFVGDGVVMDFHDKPDGYKITAKDVEEYFQKINYTLKPGDIVRCIVLPRLAHRDALRERRRDYEHDQDDFSHYSRLFCPISIFALSCRPCSANRPFRTDCCKGMCHSLSAARALYTPLDTASRFLSPLR